MSISSQISAYDDCFAVFEKAFANAKGVRVSFVDEKSAKQFQLRMCKARQLQRDESCRIYQRSDIRWNKSQYDKLTVRNPIPDDDDPPLWWVYVERPENNIIDIEELSEDNAAPFVEVVTQKLLPRPTNEDESLAGTDLASED